MHTESRNEQCNNVDSSSSSNSKTSSPAVVATIPSSSPPSLIAAVSRSVSTSKSQHAFDEVPAIVEVPMASFEQDLEDDDDDDDEDEFLADLPTISTIANQPQQHSSTTVASDEWTCKKCTLVNSQRVKACIVCGGSRLRSISAVEDMTLRKGEFWSCAACTLKNSLSSTTCSACKAARQVPVISGQQTNFRPYTSQPAQSNQKPASSSHHHHHNRQILATIASNTNATASLAAAAAAATASNNSTVTTSAATAAVSANGTPVVPNNSLAPPTHRISRSPSPKHDRSASGAVPKVCSFHWFFFSST